MRHLHVAIVGAGPAGLAAALFLDRDGHRVDLIDRFGQPEPVGSGLMLQSTGLTVLDRLGLGAAIHAAGNRIDRLYGADARSGRTVLDVRYDAAPGGRYGLAVHRAALFDVLHDAVVAAGIAIRTGCCVTAFEERGEAAFLRGEGGDVLGPYDLVVDASGARSGLAAASPAAPKVRNLTYGALWTTLDHTGAPFDDRALTQRYDQAKVMVGVLPLGKRSAQSLDQAAFFWSVKVGDAEALRRRGLDAWKHVVRGYWPDCAPLLDQIGDWDQLTLAHYRHRTMAVPYSGRLVFIGDCFHSTSPQLGQGANMALLDAAALGHALVSAQQLCEGLAAYAAARRRHVRLFQLLSLLFTPFYQSDSAALAWLRDRLVATVARIPPAPRLLASIVSGTLIDPFAAAGLRECDWEQAERASASCPTDRAPRSGR